MDQTKKYQSYIQNLFRLPRQSYLNKQNEVVKIYHATQFPNELIFSRKALSEFSN
jgi:hypothetical protein